MILLLSNRFTLLSTPLHIRLLSASACIGVYFRRLMCRMPWDILTNPSLFSVVRGVVFGVTRGSFQLLALPESLNDSIYTHQLHEMARDW